MTFILVSAVDNIIHIIILTLERRRSKVRRRVKTICEKRAFFGGGVHHDLFL